MTRYLFPQIFSRVKVHHAFLSEICDPLQQRPEDAPESKKAFKCPSTVFVQHVRVFNLAAPIHGDTTRTPAFQELPTQGFAKFLLQGGPNRVKRLVHSDVLVTVSQVNIDFGSNSLAKWKNNGVRQASCARGEGPPIVLPTGPHFPERYLFAEVMDEASEKMLVEPIFAALTHSAPCQDVNPPPLNTPTLFLQVWIGAEGFGRDFTSTPWALAIDRPSADSSA